MNKKNTLNLNKEGTCHTNKDGSVVVIKKIGDKEYFSKRKKVGKAWGSSWLFPNHLHYNGWLHMNDLVTVDIEELDDEWV